MANKREVATTTLLVRQKHLRKKSHVVGLESGLLVNAFLIRQESEIDREAVDQTAQQKTIFWTKNDVDVQ